MHYPNLLLVSLHFWGKHFKSIRQFYIELPNYIWCHKQYIEKCFNYKRTPIIWRRVNQLSALSKLDLCYPKPLRKTMGVTIKHNFIFFFFLLVHWHCSLTSHCHRIKIWMIPGWYRWGIWNVQNGVQDGRHHWWNSP